MIFFQQSVGFLVCLAFAVLFGIKCYEYALGPARVRAALCGLLTLLFLIALILRLHL